MKNKKIAWYVMAVLAYYRSEWTEVADDDTRYRLVLTKELEDLIRGCRRRGTNVPNAAKEVEIFLDLQEEKTKMPAHRDGSPRTSRPKNDGATQEGIEGGEPDA